MLEPWEIHSIICNNTNSNTNYFENTKNKCWGAFSHLGFSGSWEWYPFLPPPDGEGPWALRFSKFEKLKFCNTIKKILYT